LPRAAIENRAEIFEVSCLLSGSACSRLSNPCPAGARFGSGGALAIGLSRSRVTSAARGIGEKVDSLRCLPIAYHSPDAIWCLQLKCLKSLARPRGFEPLTFAFGGAKVARYAFCVSLSRPPWPTGPRMTRVPVRKTTQNCYLYAVCAWKSPAHSD